MGPSLEGSPVRLHHDREVSKQWPKPNGSRAFSNLSFCTARDRFSKDAMEGTGNVMVVMDGFA
jgi:hypothetical protein